MKKLINDPFQVTDELVEGFVLANAPRYRKLDDMNVVLRNMPNRAKGCCACYWWVERTRAAVS